MRFWTKSGTMTKAPYMPKLAMKMRPMPEVNSRFLRMRRSTRGSRAVKDRQTNRTIPSRAAAPKSLMKGLSSQS